MAEQAGEEVLKSIVKIQATIPKEAFTAGTLGTEREGNGVIIDSQGHIFITGYLIIEAEAIQVRLHGEENSLRANFVGYDHTTGFGLLRTEKAYNIKPVKLGKSGAIKEGMPLLIAG